MWHLLEGYLGELWSVKSGWVGGCGGASLSLCPWLVLFKLVKGCEIHPKIKQRAENVKEDVDSAGKRWSRNRALAFPAVFPSITMGGDAWS